MGEIWAKFRESKRQPSRTLRKFPDLPNKQTELKKHRVRLDETNLKEKFDEIDI
jgi:hypothetical protein